MSILIVGEAWGEKEEEVGRPFVGASGWLLNDMLGNAGISRNDCFVTNVFNLRPKPSNDVKNLCGPKDTGIPGAPKLFSSPDRYVRAEYAPELSRLYDEIKSFSPNLILALGATASWALMHTTGIKTIRGAVASTAPVLLPRLGRSFKVLPTYHPAMVLRDWSARPIVIADFEKGARESEYPEIRRPERSLWLYPEFADLERFEREHLAPTLLHQPPRTTAVDIETKGTQVTCIGFSPSPDVALVIPIFSPTSNKSYWSELEEPLVWRTIARWLATYPSVFQNGMYDLHVLWRYYGIPAPRAAHDTMLLHHAWQPELQKGLGFLATLYTDEASWKQMRKGLKHD